MYILLKYFFFSWFLALSLGCDNNDDSKDKNPPTPINYLALGDSYTIGESVEVDQRFPKLLEAQLVAAEIPWEATQIIAQTGWRTDQLLQAINQEDLLESYDIVSLLIGVNNQFQGGSIEIYQTEFAELLDRAIALANGEKEKVFVLSIPDYAFTPFGQNSIDPQKINTEIDAFNAVNKNITEAAGVSYYDITPISREGIEKPAFVASDNLHPSGTMYAAWVDSFWESVLAKIN